MNASANVAISPTVYPAYINLGTIAAPATAKFEAPQPLTHTPWSHTAMRLAVLGTAVAVSSDACIGQSYNGRPFTQLMSQGVSLIGHDVANTFLHQPIPAFVVGGFLLLTIKSWEWYAIPQIASTFSKFCLSRVLTNAETADEIKEKIPELGPMIMLLGIAKAVCEMAQFDISQYTEGYQSHEFLRPLGTALVTSVCLTFVVGIKRTAKYYGDVAEAKAKSASNISEIESARRMAKRAKFLADAAVIACIGDDLVPVLANVRSVMHSIHHFFCG